VRKGLFGAERLIPVPIYILAYFASKETFAATGIKKERLNMQTL